MRIVSYTSSIKAGKRHDLNNPITRALKNFGDEEYCGVKPLKIPHAGICFGSYTQRKLDTERAVLIQNLEKTDIPVFYCDSAAYSTYIRNAMNTSETNMFRLGLGSCTGNGTYWKEDLPSDRFEGMKKAFNFTEKDPQNNTDGSIVFLLQSETGWMYDSKEPYSKFLQSSLEKIRSKTDRKIIIRTHPTGDLAFRKWLKDPQHHLHSFFKSFSNYEVHHADRARRSLFDSMSNVHSVITHSSSAALECVVEGIPTFALDDRCFGSGMYLKDLDKIESAYDEFKWEKRDQWMYNIAYTSWTTEELKSQEVKDYYLSWI